MGRVSSHSGMPEEAELKALEEKACRLQREEAEKLSRIYGVLDPMPAPERSRLLAEIVRHYLREGARRP